MPKGTAFDIELFKTFSATAVKKTGEAGTVVFEPGEGKRFRLLGLCLAADAESIFTLEDEGTAFFVITVPKTPTMLVFNFPAQGYLSKVNKNKLLISKPAEERKITGTIYGIEDVA